ncbi:hypothetical protein BDF22DRAFT_744198 [Syncephalis plumigaleata]|nr:hypothetical protein BDF22DRAFT_744198 [Syncephalis plumigaleata]
MPVINYNDPKETEWIETAVRIAGIPLHPSGETSIADYLMAASGDQHEQRRRFTGIQIETVFATLSMCLFARNLTMTARALLLRQRTLPLYCSFTASFFNMIMVVIYLLVPAAEKLNCRIGVWGLDVSISISILCNNLILLHKAYLVLMQHKWVLYIGIALTLPPVGYPFLSIVYFYITVEPQLGCTVHYPSFTMWYWVGINVPFNIVFSTIFCYVAYKQYKLFGSEIWKRLTREGIQTMCLALLCNIICVIVVLSHIEGANQDILFAVDWAVVTTILTDHCCRKRSNTTVQRHTRTSYMQHVSQIDTVK